MHACTVADLFSEQLEQIKSVYGGDNYYLDEAKGWLYRLFNALRVTFDLQKPIVSEMGLTKFLELYKSRRE